MEAVAAALAKAADAAAAAAAKAAEDTAATIAKAVEQAIIKERYARFLEERRLIKLHASGGRLASNCKSWCGLRMG
jgi:hypothetical protein